MAVRQFPNPTQPLPLPNNSYHNRITDPQPQSLQLKPLQNMTPISKYPSHPHQNHPNSLQLQTKSKPISSKINIINYDLQSFHKQTIQYKVLHLLSLQQHSKQLQKHKKKYAIQMITRLKKQKQLHHNKLQINQMNIKLKNSQMSQQIMEVIKKHREKLMQQKKRHMRLRIQRNIKRKVQRQQDQTKKQLKYWSKVKQFQQQKHSNSTKLLPSIDKIIDVQQESHINKCQKQKIYHHKIYNRRASSKQQIPFSLRASKSKSKIQSIPLSISPQHQTSPTQSKKKLRHHSQLPSTNSIDISHSQNPPSEPPLKANHNPSQHHQKNATLAQYRHKVMQNLLNKKKQKKQQDLKLSIQMKLDHIKPQGKTHQVKCKLEILQKCQSQPLQIKKSNQLGRDHSQMDQKLQCQLYKNQFLQ